MSNIHFTTDKFISISTSNHISRCWVIFKNLLQFYHTLQLTIKLWNFPLVTGQAAGSEAEKEEMITAIVRAMMSVYCISTSWLSRAGDDKCLLYIYIRIVKSIKTRVYTHCVHNTTVEDHLMHQISCLLTENKAFQTDWHMGRNKHNALMNRGEDWQTCYDVIMFGK